jgi:hypothetical protein
MIESSEDGKNEIKYNNVCIAIEWKSERERKRIVESRTGKIT